ncbi:MAG TPA: error-prone DNA polymerase [Streptosporangiaceae bacterium]|nr:error-prone DNA polymerase [Streptosporangiaceae bacterium]
MGWDNPPVPWRELERRLSWGARGREAAGGGRAAAGGPAAEPRTVARLPTASRASRSGQAGRGGHGPAWAELHCHSSYSFLDGASAPAELIAEAARRGLAGLAITDHDGMYGVPQFAQAAARLKEQAGAGIGTVFGAELSLGLPAGGQGRLPGGPAAGPAGQPSAALAAGPGKWLPADPRAGAPDPAGRHLLVLARDPEGYRRLCRVISMAQLAGDGKGRPVYDLEALAQAHGGHWVILTGCRKGAVPAALAAGGPEAAAAELEALAAMFGREHVMVELTSHDQPADDERNDALHELAARSRTAVIATGNVHYATPGDARLAQALAAVRARRSLDEMDGWLAASGAAYLRSGAEMAHRLRRYPGVAERTVALARDCAFDFHVIAPRLPVFPVPGKHTEATWLRTLVARKAPQRYGPPDGERVTGAYAQIDRELGVIETLGFAGYFLIVHDIVRFCEQAGILCQGRGSAANSAVCYALGITGVDPVRHGLLFERFLSAGRDGPPDIDLDIEHRRREEVIQYVYGKYGRDKAAQVANVISYRPRMALRDAGRALGYAPQQQDRWAKQVGPRQYGAGQPIPADAGVPEPVTELAARMQRLPRHLGIHSGGMVICDRPVGDVCPVEWARMPGRSVLQWDKDDCAYAGLVKFDLLGLGMLTALRDCFELVAAHHGESWSLHTIPQEDPRVYDMLCEADTVGVFQVESRAQMATLPRLLPREFYDLVVEVALIRPGPIQGGSVHPYMRRRRGDEPPDLPHESMRRALGKTFGVPLFQEQMMQLSVDCAGFSPAEADQLRQAMSSKRGPERIEELRGRLLAGMAARGIPAGTGEDIYAKIVAFSSYGFPESHAISFAYLVYASAWLKLYYPAAFTAALLRAQPMGFYSPASLIGDARRHGVRVRGVDVNASAVVATLGGPGSPGTGRPVQAQPAIRLGLAGVRNLGPGPAAVIVAGQPYRDLEDFARRTTLPAPALEALAMAGAFGCFGMSRREALWAAGAAATIRPGQLPGSGTGLAAPPLAAMTAAEETFADLWATGTSGVHPVAHIRGALAERGVIGAAELKTARPGAAVVVAGLVTHRQQPGTARGVVFLGLEDETGMANVICPPPVWERHRRLAVDASALLVHGRVERLEGAVSLLATRLERLAVAAAVRSRDFR